MNSTHKLFNIGNSCYLNSVLQCLFNNELFMKILIEIYKHPCGDFYVNNKLFQIKDPEKLANFKTLLIPFLKLYVSSKKTTNDKEIVANIGELKNLLGQNSEIFKGDEMFKGNNQQDAHECLSILLEIFHKYVSNTIKLKHDILNVTKRDILKDENKPVEYFINYVKKFGYSFINYIFSGQMISTVFCTVCHNKNNSIEIFNDIFLNIPYDKCSIKECFGELFKTNTLEDPITCDVCKKKTICRQKTSIWAFPRTLILVLKRYDLAVIGRNNFAIKLDKEIVFDIGGKLITYNLNTVINHHGINPNFGHYTTFVPTTNDEHILMDDDITINCKLPEYSHIPYILTYDLINN